MNLLKHVVSYTLWTVVCLYAALMTAVQIPAVQRYASAKIASALSAQVGSEVRIGRIDVGFLNRLVIDSLYVADQSGKELLSADRLSVRIALAPAVEGKIRISSAQLFGAHATLYRRSATSPLNCQFLIDSLSSADTTGRRPLDLRIGSLIVRRSGVTYDEWDTPLANGRFSPQHIGVSDISAHVVLKALTDDSLSVNVKRLAFREQSGVHVRKLSFAAEAGRHGARLQNLHVSMPSSVIRADSLTASYDARDVGGTVSYKGGVNFSTSNLSEFAVFVPLLKDYREPVEAVVDFHGGPHQLAVDRLGLSSPGGDFSLLARGTLGLQSRWPACDVELEQLHVTSPTATRLIPQATTVIAQFGDVGLKGRFANRPAQGMAAEGWLTTGIGDAHVKGQLKEDSRQFDVAIDTEDLDLSPLAGSLKLGHFAGDVNASGTLGKSTLSDLSVQGTVKTIEYAGHAYKNIAFSGSHNGQNTKAWLHIADERLKAEVEADVTGTTLSDLTGVASLKQLSLPEDDLHLSFLRIESDRNDEGVRHLLLNSDFFHAELTGDFDYTTIPQSITAYVRSKLPTLPGLPAQTAQTGNNFTLHLAATESPWIEKLVGTDVQLQAPMSLSVTVNDHTRQIEADGQLPHFSYDGTSYKNGRLRVTSPQDTMRIDAQLTRTGEDGEMKLALSANAADNNLNTSMAWENLQAAVPTSGRFNAVGRLYVNARGQSEAHVSVLPSDVNIGSQLWSVEPSDIIYTTDRLLIDHFSIHSGNQFVKVNGTASKAAADTVAVELNDVEVAYVLDLVDFDAVAFSGFASGKASVSAVLGEPAASARLTVNQFKFEQGRMGTLTAAVNWNNQLKQIDIDATADDGADAQTYISGFVAPVESDHHREPCIDLAILGRGTHIDFMHSFTESFLSDVGGHAYGDLRLHGPLSEIQLTGQLVVDGQATVTPLGTTYTLHRDTVTMIPDEIALRRVTVKDKHGNTAYLSGGIHHEHLTNLTFDLDVETDRLLGYDFPAFDGMPFFGTVVTAGRVTIEGRPGRVTIDCDVTPLNGTTFVYNTTQADAVSAQEFVTWTPHPSTAVSKGVPSSYTPLPQGGGGGGTDIYLNFIINATPDATLRLLMDAQTDDYITLHGSGALRATYHNKGAFQMFGTYTVDNGTYDVTIQNIIKKKFQFQEGGTIVFGGDPYDAALALQAVYVVNGVSLSDLQLGNSFSQNTIRVNCLMNIGGQPKAPTVTFDLDMPTVNADEKQMVRSLLASGQEMNQQVLYLLGIGRFYNQGQNNANTQQSDQTSLAMQSFLSGTLSTQINTVLNSMIKNDSWNFGANISTGTEGWNNAEYEGIINGRMLNNKLLVNGQFGYRDNATQATPSFIGDFDIRYLLNPNGNLALKFYNQTNDRYFTRSSLNTQGIGVILKKDFNGLSDLFRRKKKNKD